MPDPIPSYPGVSEFSAEVATETGQVSGGVETALNQSEDGKKALERLKQIDINDGNIISAGIEAWAREQIEAKYHAILTSPGRAKKQLAPKERQAMEKEIKDKAAIIENDRENLKDKLGGDGGKRRTYVLERINNPNTAIGSAAETEYQQARWDLVDFETKLFVQGLKAQGFFDELGSLATKFNEYTTGAKGAKIRTSERRAFIEGISEKIAAYSTVKMKQERMQLRAVEIREREEKAEPNFLTRNFHRFQELWRRSVYWRMGIGGGLFVAGTAAAAFGMPFVAAAAYGARAAFSAVSSGVGTTLTTEALMRKFEEKRIQGIGNALTKEDKISKLSGHGGPRVKQVTEWLAANLAATGDESRTHLGETDLAPERPEGKPHITAEALATEKRLMDEFYRRLAIKIKDQMGKELVDKVGTGKVTRTYLNELMMETLTGDALKVKLETGKAIREQEEALDQETVRQARAKRERRIRRWLIAGGVGLTVGTITGIMGAHRAMAAAERATHIAQAPIPGAGGPPTETPPLGPGTPTPSGPPASGLPPLEPNTPGTPPVPPAIGGITPQPGLPTITPPISGVLPPPHEIVGGIEHGPHTPLMWAHGAGEQPIKVGEWVDNSHIKIGGKTFEVINDKINVGVDINHDGIADAGHNVDIDVTNGKGLYEGHTIQAWDKNVDFDTQGKFDLVARTGRIVDVTGDGKVDIQVWGDDKGLLHASHDINIKGFSLDNQPITEATKITSPDEVFNRALKFEHFVPHDGVNPADPGALARDISGQFEKAIGNNYTIGTHGELLNYNATAEQKLAAYLAKDPSFLEHIKDRKFSLADLQKAHENAVVKGLTAPPPPAGEAATPTTPEPSAPVAPENPIHIGDWDTLKQVYKIPVPDRLRGPLFEAVEKSNLMDEQNLANLKQAFARKGVEVFTHSTQTGSIDGIAIHYPSDAQGLEFKFPADKAIPKLELVPPSPNIDAARDDASRLDKTRQLIASIFGVGQNNT